MAVDRLGLAEPPEPPNRLIELLEAVIQPDKSRVCTVLPTVNAPQVDYVGLKAGAQYQNTVSQTLDRLSNQLFGIAKTAATEAGLQYAADNPLTDEEIADCAEKMEASDPTDSFWREFFRGIEAKLKEKNNG